MLDGIIFDKDGTLFGFRASWGGWSRKVLADLARDPDHAEQLAESIGFDLQRLDFAPDSLVIAGTMDEVAGALHPHLAPMLWSDLVVRLNTIGAANPMVPAVPSSIARREICALRAAVTASRASLRDASDAFARNSPLADSTSKVRPSLEWR